MRDMRGSYELPEVIEPFSCVLKVGSSWQKPLETRGEFGVLREQITYRLFTGDTGSSLQGINVGGFSRMRIPKMPLCRSVRRARHATKTFSRACTETFNGSSTEAAMLSKGWLAQTRH